MALQLLVGLRARNVTTCCKGRLLYTCNHVRGQLRRIVQHVRSRSSPLQLHKHVSVSKSRQAKSVAGISRDFILIPGVRPTQWPGMLDPSSLRSQIHTTSQQLRILTFYAANSVLSLAHCMATLLWFSQGLSSGATTHSVCSSSGEHRAQKSASTVG